MKLLCSTLIITVLLFIGCSENQNITSPIDDTNFEKITDPNDPNYLNAEEATILLDHEPQWVPLPLITMPGVQLPDYHEVSKMIYKDRYNNLFISFTYPINETDSVKLAAKLTFFAGAIQPDSLLVTAKIDTRNGTLIFEPHTQFNFSVFLDYYIKGINVSELNASEIDFAYGGADGVLELIDYFYLGTDEEEDELYMMGGKLHHFSRYGFVRRNVNH